MPKKVLVLEDESSIRSFVVINLGRAGYEPIEAGTAEEAFERITENPDIQVALLDIMLPGEMNGLEVCRRLRAANPAMGIIMLTAKAQEVDKVTGLMNGADDYITKPFSTPELIARVDVMFRRVGGTPEAAAPAKLVSGPFSLDLTSRTLHKNGERIKLTGIEFDIVTIFLENPGKAFSRQEILSKVWTNGNGSDTKIVDVNIRRLRIKLEDDPTNPVYINTIWSFGYKWGE
ncbi:MAG: response regulator transcription factor [Oscillospiraceae bacterium]|jgi:DNA-binding response OmpR family regulator|nr:response regulator transcription factor [Oscillospiraceae bacterium]